MEVVYNGRKAISPVQTDATPESQVKVVNESAFVSVTAPPDQTPQLRLTPDTTRSLAVLIFSVLMIWFGLKVVESGNPEGWFMVCIFSLSTIASLTIVLPGSCYLQVDGAGVTISSCFRKRQYRWDQIERMGIFQVGIIRRVGVDLNARYAGPERVPKFDKPASGYHVSLPAMNGMELEDLLELMQQCHAARAQHRTA